MDRRDRVELFRRRLAEAMAARGRTRAALARDTHVDRSTVSQLLDPASSRLPNGQLVAACAETLGVSADWLLGLSDRPEQAAELLRAGLDMPPAGRALIDEQIFAWHREAAGAKVRHVPATLPDMLKTDAFLAWEYDRAMLGVSPEGRTRALAATRERAEWMRGGHADYEIAIPRHEIVCMARGQGYYASLPDPVRRAQIDHFQTLITDLFPMLRVSVYDARVQYSAPLTVFGRALAVIYAGPTFLVFRDTARVRQFTDQFDALVRENTVLSGGVRRWLSTFQD